MLDLTELRASLPLSAGSQLHGDSFYCTHLKAIHVGELCLCALALSLFLIGNAWPAQLPDSLAWVDGHWLPICTAILKTTSSLHAHTQKLLCHTYLAKLYYCCSFNHTMAFSKSSSLLKQRTVYIMHKCRGEINKGSDTEYVYTIIIFHPIMTWNWMKDSENI